VTWLIFALGVGFGLILGAFLWTALALRRTRQELLEYMPEDWVRRYFERLGR
jgi:hypothetical protein